MLPVKAWRIVYADGSEFTSKDGAWAEAPPFGVVCVAYYTIPSGVTLHVRADDESVYEYLGGGEYEGVKMGLWMDPEGFYRLVDYARRSSEP